ncbi:MAG: hypothetical protein HY755_05710 [Nitrospirae bacterium]|nr:hypothetical protein [Nitrospirota bacterium]
MIGDKKEIKRIEKLIKKAQRSLRLSSYKIRCNLVKADYSEYAGIICQHPKRTATIDFNRKRIHQELENTVIHELLHLLFNKHLSVAEDVFERQRKYKSLRKYQKGEEKIINILAPLLEKVIFENQRRR